MESRIRTNLPCNRCHRRGYSSASCLELPGSFCKQSRAWMHSRLVSCPRTSLLLAAILLAPGTALAESGTEPLKQTGSAFGIVALLVFVAAYAFVVLEERLHLRKSKPVMLGAAVIWALIAWHAADTPAIGHEYAAAAFRHVFLEFAELFFFLIVAM